MTARRDFAESNFWTPHVYLMRCTVNEPLLDLTLHVDDTSDPQWLVELRAEHTPPNYELLTALRQSPFFKVGSTYSEDPETRTGSLRAHKPNYTMSIYGVPVIGSHDVAYIPGPRELEQAIHRRWADDRIDPRHEFFWDNDEMTELWEVYGR